MSTTKTQIVDVESVRNVMAQIQVDVIIANVQTVDTHWRREHYVHNFNRMYFILGGEGQIEVDGVTMYPLPGQLVVMPCHIRQSYATVNNNPFHKYWCHFTARVGSRDLFEMYRFPVCIDVPNPSEIEHAFKRMINHMQHRSPASILHVRSSMLHCLGIYIEACLQHMLMHSPSSVRMHRVIQYIEEHLHEKITVDALAGLVHYHPNYFIKAFRTVFGCSPIQYIQRLRLEKARQLLSTDLPIGSIAHAVGIERHNFSSMFKSYTGFSPRNFRKLL